MIVIPFPPRPTPSQKAVADFKRVCDQVGLEVRDEAEVTATLDRLQAELGGAPEPLKRFRTTFDGTGTKHPHAACVAAFWCGVALSPDGHRRSSRMLPDTRFIVIQQHGGSGPFPETTLDRTNLEDVLDDLAAGQYDRPFEVIAFNLTEGWSRNFTDDVAAELQHRANISDHDLLVFIVAFVWRNPRRDR